VIAIGILKLQYLLYGETIRPFRVEEDRLGFEEYTLADQHSVSRHLWLIDAEW